MGRNRKLATQKQIHYAENIARTLGINVSFEEDESYYDVNKFIRLHESQFKNSSIQYATQRQIDYANAMSEVLGLGKTFDSNSIRDDVSDFITENKTKYNIACDKNMICGQTEKYELKYNNLINEEAFDFLIEKLYGKHGLYAFVDSKNEICYIGKSKNLASRIPTSYKERASSANISRIMYYTDENMANVNIMEILLISEYSPVLNTESNTEDVPTKFHSGIDILNDFKEVPVFYNSGMEVEA